MEVFLVRHGESLGNRDRRIQGWSGQGLSDSGRNEATGAGRELKRRGIDALYSSDLQRAAETSEIIGALCELPSLKTPAFREIKLGPWEGRTLKEVEDTDGKALWDWRYDGRRPPYPEIEPLESLATRLMNGLEEIRAAQVRKAAVVSHGGAISVMLTRILGLELLRIWQMPTENASISRLSHDGKRWYVSSFNEMGHLTRESGAGFNSLG